MAKKISVSYEQQPCYDIVIEEDFQLLPETLRALGYGANKACIITDSNVGAHYLASVMEQIRPVFSDCTSFVFPAGETSKNTDTVGDVYAHLIQHAFDRKDVLIALGGGVVGDLTGFTAATYLRGIDFIQIPSSLLSQVDSSVGGKTGVDFMQYKNMVGAFYMPRLVYMNLSLLQTLPGRQFASGMAEVLKYGLIKDAGFFSYLKEHRDDIVSLQREALEKTVAESCDSKRDTVERDPKEKGERALLNFGHTIGHAIEKLSDFELYHGECVALGMVGAAYISFQLGGISKEALAEIEQTISSYELPVRIPAFSHSAEEILAVTKLDKKMEAGKIKFILLHEIGNAYITRELTDAQILAGIQYILGK